MVIWTPSSGPLGLKAELDMGGWTDISTYAYQREGTSPAAVIKRGRANEQASATPVSVTMQWNNRGGQFTPRNPTGAYYGLLGRNTPLRLSVPAGTNYLRVADDQASGASCPGSAGLTLSADFDVRIDMQLDNWQPCFLAGMEGLWELTLNGDGTVTFEWLDTSSVVRTASSSMPVPLGRSMIRCYFDPAGTSGAAQVLFYTAATMAASQSQLGNAVPITAGDYASSGVTPLQVAVGSPGPLPGLQGAVYEARVYNGATLAAGPVFSAQADGTTSFSDGQGNTWTCSGSAQVSGRNYRAHAECTTLPQRWDNTGNDIWTPAQASGVLRRIQQGSSPLPSVMKRGIQVNASAWNVVAYWPCEDSQGSTQIASGLPGGQPMQFSGAPGFQAQAGSPSADGNFACSAQLAQVQSSTWTGTVPVSAAMIASGTAWVNLLVCIPSSGVTGTNLVLAQLQVPGGAILLGYSSASGGTLLGGNITGGVTTWYTAQEYTGCDGQALLVQMLLQAGMTGFVQEQGSAYGSGQVMQSGSGAATGSCSGIIINPAGAAFGATEVGHIWAAYGNPWPQPIGDAETTLGSYLNAWQGETAANRVLRLCSENGIPARVYGYPDLSMPMGPQPIDTFGNNLQYCEDADGGLLFEPMEALGVGYRTLGSMCNQSAGLVLDYASQVIGDGDALLEPQDDDAFTVNDYTASRNGGSSAQVQVTTGSLSIQDPPDGVGDYSSSKTFYNAWDADLARIAGWKTWTGTADVERYPAVPLNLGRPQLASLQAVITGLRIGDYFQMTQMPQPQSPPGTAGQLHYGSTEGLGGFWWQLSLNAVPEDPFDVAAAGSAYAESAGAWLVFSATSTATTLYVASMGGYPAWITGSGLSIPVIVAGEEMAVTAIASTAVWQISPDGTFETTIAGWFSQNGSAPVRSNAEAHTGSYSALVISAASGNTVLLSPAIAVTPLASVVGGTWLYFGSPSLTGLLSVNWYSDTAGADYMSTSAGSTITPAASTWTECFVTAIAPEGARSCRICPVMEASGSGEYMYSDDVLLQVHAQAFTVTRGVNGVSKSQAAGASLAIAQPPVTALAGNH